MAKTDPSTNKERVIKPGRRWRRRALWLLVIGPLGVIAGVLVIGQTSVVKMIVEPILEDQLGVEVSSQSIHLMPTGVLVINDAVCRDTAIDHRGGSLIELKQATIEINWWGVFRGNNQVRSIQMDQPIVRVSQDINTGVLNLAAIKLKKSSSNTSGSVPEVQIIDGVLEIGEHDQDSYRVLKELSIRGILTEQLGTGVSAFDFVGLPTEPSMSSSVINTPGSFGLTGQISETGIDGVLDGVRLEDWPAEIVPSRSRGMYQRLNLTGELAPTRFHVSPDGLIDVVLILNGVALNLPFDESGSVSESVDHGQLLRMRQTRGTVRFGTNGLLADIKGMIDELEYDVDLEVQGLDAQSPFEATLVTNFRLDEHFKPIEFLPPRVMSKLDRFENPTADVHAELSVSRSKNPDIGFQVSGRVELSRGSAIYKKFRYPFADMSGVIEFDSDKLVIRDIKGVGPTGARLVANGVFSPLGEQSVVNLDLDIQGVAIDEHLLAALDEDKKKLVSALFHEPGYSRLLGEGLVLTQDDAATLGQLRRQAWDRLDGLKDTVDNVDQVERRRQELAHELAKIDQQLAAPVFAFGGAADVQVKLVRHPERDENDRWTTDVHVKLPVAGLVPEHFQMPIIANNVELLITEDLVELRGGHYTGLGGGSATVEVAIDLTSNDVKPVIEITARSFPIDPSMISAIPGYSDPQSDDPDDLSLRRILDRLNLSGVLDCDAIIGPRSDGRLGFDIESTVLSGHARPRRLVGIEGVSQESIALDDLYGTIYVTEELIIVDLDAMLSSPDQPIAPTPIEVLTQLTMPNKQRGLDGTKRQRGLLPTEFGPALPGPKLYASAYADGIDLAMPLEHAIAVISPRVARDLLSKSQIYQPNGVLAMGARLEGVVGGAIDTELWVDRIDEIGFDFDEVHYKLSSAWGRSEFALSSEPTIEFDGFRVSIHADGEPAGVLSLDGLLALSKPGRSIEISEHTELRIDYQDGKFDSPITQEVIRRLAGSNEDSWLEARNLGGRFDLGVTLTPKLGVHWMKDQPDDPRSVLFVPTLIHGALNPRSVSLEMNDQRVEFPQVSGSLVFDGFEGKVDQVQANDGSTSIGVDGSWTMEPGEGISLALSIDAKGDLLGGAVRSILPGAVETVIGHLKIQSHGAVEVEGLQITGERLGQQDAVYDVVGAVELFEGSAVIGLPITGIVGDLGFAAHGTSDTLGYEIYLEASRLRAGLMRMHDARVSIIGDAYNSGVVLIPEISARMHGGQIAGSAQIRPNDDGEQQYWMELHASGVRAAPVFDDLFLPSEGLVGPPRPGQDTVLSAWSQGEDLSKGALIADLTLTGPINDPSKRSGRGLVQIAGGSVVAMPGLLPLIEASNLSLPAGSPLDLAEAAFYVDGHIMAFEQLSASSKRIEILGYGTMDWTTREVDLRFRSRAVHPIPVVSQLIEKLRDELITTRVTGKMGDMNYSMQQFGSTRRLIGSMLGRPMSDQQRRMREVEQQVQASRNRLQWGEGDVLHLPTEQASQVPGWDGVDQ